MGKKDISKVTFISNILWNQFFQEGSIVVDATLGNGWDTLSLCEIVGEKGKVYAFDIQEEAFESSKKKLEDHGYLNRVTFIKESHEFINLFVKEEVDGVIFNLGYLPGQSHELATNLSSTLKAIKMSLDLLKKDGIITIAVYLGHPQGKEEEMAVNEFLKNLDSKDYRVVKLDNINQQNSPPVLFCLQRR